MELEENKVAVRSFFEAVNRHNLDEAAGLFAPEYLDHYGPVDAPPTRGSALFKQFYGTLLRGFPDLHQTLEDQIAEGDLVASRKTYRGTHKGEFMGIPATGKVVEVAAIDIMRVANGMLVEHWGVGDLLALMQQLRPPPAPPKSS